jgi:hypothetical protein
MWSGVLTLDIYIVVNLRMTSMRVNTVNIGGPMGTYIVGLLIMDSSKVLDLW